MRNCPSFDRNAFPARSNREKAALGRYRECIRAIKTELLAKDNRVRVNELNAANYQEQVANAIAAGVAEARRLAVAQ